MSFALTWLPDVLREAGLKVAEVDGWRTRGRGEIGQIEGVICHHTVGQRSGNMPSLNTLVRGTRKLAGPLSQLGLGRDGTWYVVAAGRCNHAGEGRWQGISDGNAHFIGVEGENTGLLDDFPWPEVQMDAYRRGVAAILAHVGKGADACAGHREYAPGRKIDPLFDMDEFRRAVAAILDGSAPGPTLIPAVEPAPPGPGTQPRPTLRRGDRGPQVEALQAKLRLAVDGDFGGRTEASVRAFQRERAMVPDGIVGPKTWAALDRV